MLCGTLQNNTEEGKGGGFSGDLDETVIMK